VRAPVEYQIRLVHVVDGEPQAGAGEAKLTGDAVAERGASQAERRVARVGEIVDLLHELLVDAHVVQARADLHTLDQLDPALSLPTMRCCSTLWILVAPCQLYGQ